MTIKEFIQLTDTISLNEIYDLQLLLKRKAYERKEEQKQNIKSVENSYPELVDFVSKGLGFDIKDKSRKRDYTFARFAFVGIMHEKIETECEGKKGWSIIGKCINKDHATVIHCYRMHELETATNNLTYNEMYLKVHELITKFFNKKDDNNGESI